MRFCEAVRAEFQRRRAVNARYSLRRFAALLGVHHATLSRLLRGGRGVPVRTICTAGRSLGLSSADVANFVAIENAAAVTAAIGRPGFYPDSRRLAVMTGITTDNVNIALHTMLRDGRLRMVSPTLWTVAPR